LLILSKQNYIIPFLSNRRLNHKKKRISYMNNIILKTRKVFSASVTRIKIELFVRYEPFRSCHVRRLLSLYPIAGSENIFRYLDSPWGRVPDADFLRPATNHQSSPSPTTSTHPQPHIKTKKKQPYPWSLHQHGESYFSSSSSSSFYIISYFNPLSRDLLLSKVLGCLRGSRFVSLIAL